MSWKFELPLSSQGKFWQKHDRFYEFTWQFGLSLLSRAEIFSKIKRFVEVFWKFALPWLSRAEIFAKNKADLIEQLENLNCPYYHEVKCPQK